MLEITPDIGLQDDLMFNENLNPKLVQIDIDELTVASDPADEKFVSRWRPRILVDIGSGLQAYDFASSLLPANILTGIKYLYRFSGSPDNVREFILV